MMTTKVRWEHGSLERRENGIWTMTQGSDFKDLYTRMGAISSEHDVWIQKGNRNKCAGMTDSASRATGYRTTVYSAHHGRDVRKEVDEMHEVLM
jgi:hypothetical protein